MPENYYADAEMPQAQSAAPQSESEPEMEDQGDSETAVLPKSVLGGKEFKPGDEVVLEVTQVNEDSVVVRYASGEDESGEEGGEYGGPPEGAGPPAGAGGMASMME